MTVFLELIAVAVLILLNGYFVAAEYGLVTVRRTRIAELAQQEHNRRARQVLLITDSPPRFIAAMQLGVTLTSLAIGALGEQALAEVFDPFLATALAIVLAYLILTFFHVVIGELVPKAVALRYSERVALAVSTPVRIFFVVSRPLIWLLQHSTELLLRVFGLQAPGAAGTVHSEAELKMLVSESTERGEIEAGEQEMLYKVFDFADKEVEDVMVPRPQVVALSVDLPPEEALQAVLESPYTRYPVYRGSLDEIVGVLHVRDLIEALYERGLATVRIADLVRPAYMVPETKDLAALLTEFRRQNQHMASSSTSTARWRASSRSRTCWRRSSARSRTSSTYRTSRSSGSTSTRSASTAHSRSTTSTSSSRSISRRRTTTPSRASSSASSDAPLRWATRCATTGSSSVSTRSRGRASSV